MTGARSRLILVAVIALGLEGAAAADDPAPEDGTEAPDAPGTSAITTVPAPPPPPLLPVRGDGAAVAGDPEPANPRVADPRFGDEGQVSLNGELSASFGRLGFETGSATSTSVSIQPAFDYFTLPDFSQGVSVFFRYVDAAQANGIDYDATTIGAAGRIGRNFWLGGRVSFWPTLALGWWRAWLHYTAQTGGGVNIDGMNLSIGQSSRFTESSLYFEIQAPILFHLVRHFFVGFGPDAFIDVAHSVGSASNRRRFIGASSTIGGWF